MPNQFKCGRCGTLIDYGTTTCPQCGRTFQYAAKKQGPSRSPHFASAYDTTEEEIKTPAKTEQIQEPAKEKSPNRILWIIIALLSAIIIAGTIYFLFIKKSDKTDREVYLIQSQTEEETMTDDEMAGWGDDEYIGEDAVREAQLWMNARGQREKTGKRQVIINGEGVRLRFKPSLKAEYLKQKNGHTQSVPKGTALPYLGENDEWYKVKYKDRTFYVSKQFSYIKK